MTEDLLYENDLRELFIQQELRGYLIRKEWCLLDIIAVKLDYNHKIRRDFSEIHAFEIKSSRDNPYRFFSQLPYYVWIADFVWLILGARHKIPKKLPKWVGVIKFNGETFDRVYVPTNESFAKNEFETIKQIYVANYGLPDNGKFDNTPYSASWRFLVSFIRKWFINAVFGTKKQKLIPYSNIERALLYYLQRVDALRDTVYIERKGILRPRHIPLTEEQLAKVWKATTLLNYTE